MLHASDYAAMSLDELKGKLKETLFKDTTVSKNIWFIQLLLLRAYNEIA